MKFEFSKTLINHCNKCLTMFLLLEKTHKLLKKDLKMT
jgi:hypothetical protein